MKPESLHKPRILVLFDIDGTLLIGRGSGRAATERAMMEVFGTVGNLADVPFGGKTDFYTLVHVLTPEGFTEAQIADTLPHYSTVVTRHMQDIIHSYDIHALPGTHELVNAVAAHPDLLAGILTGNVLQMADLKLEFTGFDPAVFKIAAYGSEARIRRDLLPLAMGRAEQHAGTHFAPQDVVILGDTVDDIDCAHSAGARVIAVTTGHSPREVLEQHQPVTVVDDFSDTQAIMRLILGEM